MLDDGKNIQKWGLINNLTEIIVNTFGDSLFTLEDKKNYANEWPSINQLIKKGKRIMFTNGVNYFFSTNPS